jgi:ring-1,2-phenylacetyl-CoA epoxidase subunit PaaD
VVSAGAALARNDEALRARGWEAAAQVCDPEIPVLSIADLGVLRGVEVTGDGTVEVAITPTYSGCPAMDVIGVEVALALVKAGIEKARVRHVLSPAWTTDWMSEEGRAKLLAYGIAPPAAKSSRRALFGDDGAACPRCGSADTRLTSAFGPTACTTLHVCGACGEPFEKVREQ